MKLLLITFALSLACGCTAQVASDSPPPAVTVSWPASTSKGVSYNIYRADGQCGAQGQMFEKITPSPVNALTYTDTAVRRGRKYCYRMTATDGKSESSPTQTIDVVIPQAEK